MFSEKFIRKQLTAENFEKWLQINFYDHVHNSYKSSITNEWNPYTGSCAMHVVFTVEQLGKKMPEKMLNYIGFKIVTENSIDHILDLLDKGKIIEFIHTYRDRHIVNHLPKENRYGSHDFAIIKASSENKYFVAQSYLHAYKHSLISYTKDEIKTMLHDIITGLSDYENNKVWSDVNMKLHKKYFRTDLKNYYGDPFKKDGKMHNIVLSYCFIE
jgi:hypothetical protein